MSSFRKVHAKFYRCRLNSLAWVLYQSLAPGSRISKIFEKVSIGITFREVHAHFYRCRPNGLAWVSYPILFAAFKKISESQFVKNANFGRKKFEFYKFSKKTSIECSFRKVYAKFYRCRPNSLALVLYQSLAPGSRNFSKSQFTKTHFFGEKN